MTIVEIARFEVGHRLRRPATWGFAALLFAVPFLMMHAINGSTIPLNAPDMVLNATNVLGIVSLLVSAALFGDAAMRDAHTRMDALFYTTPIRERDYLLGRFAGTFAVNALLQLAIPVALLLASLMPYMAEGKFGPPRLAPYVDAYLIFLLPNLLLGGAVLFAVAATTRQTVATYLAGVGLVLARTLATELTDGLANRAATALADPFGAEAVAHVTRYWTLAERETRGIGLPDVLLWNRLLWIGVALLVLGALVARFRFSHSVRLRERRRRAADAEPRRATPIVVPTAPRDFGRVGWVRQTLAVAARSFADVARSRTFLVLLAGAIAFVFAVGWDVGAEVFGTSTWPVTHLVAGTVLTTVLGPMMALLVALFAGELVWRERELRLSEIADAAPLPDGAALAGRVLALVGLLVALQAVLLVAGVALQAVRGWHHFELGLYARILFGFTLVDYLLFAALAVAVHVLVDQKYVGHLVVVLCYMFTLFAARFGIRHNLLVYGGDPGWIYSDMNGFGPFTRPFVWFKLYWAGWALLLAVLANLLWVRGRERALRDRLATARRRFGGAAAAAAGVGAALVVGAGAFVFYNTNVLNDYRTPEEAAAADAEYERRYARYAALPQPRIVASGLAVELHPARRTVELRGTYRLVNRTARPMDSIHVLLEPELDVLSISFSRASHRALDDRTMRYQIHALSQPLLPGDSILLHFDLRHAPRGFPNSGISTAVAANGAYFDRRWLPIVGYQPSLELEDPEARREHGLPPRPPTPPQHDLAARQHRYTLRDADLVHSEVVIGTDADQIAVTPGTLVREWREGGRRYFRYRSGVPLPNGTAIFSGRYAVREDRWTDTAEGHGRPVALRVYHHPTHGVNVDRMLGGMKASLGYLSEQFGPYQFDELRIVEFPRYASFARAHPHTIAFSEGSAFLTRVEPGDVDRTFFVAAHETAHQWWGGQVMGGRVRGAGLLTETLAQYSAMMTMERALGRDQARRFYDFEMDRYLQGRRTFSNREVPLLDVDGQAYLHYHKGAVAMYALREAIGEARVNLALRRYLERFRDAGPPFPTSHDLYAELRAVTPDSVRPLLRDLFEDMVMWEVRADSARVERTSAGGYRVALTVTARKARADSLGRETPLPMDDLVEIGVFGEPAAGTEGSGAPLYLRPHRLRAGTQTIVVTVPRPPASAGVDPYLKLIQRERDDNVADVEPAGAARVAPGSDGG